MPRLSSVFAAFAVAACGGADKPSPAPPSNSGGTAATGPSCSEQVAAFKTFLHTGLDPKGDLKPPFPTGDAAEDKRIDEAKARLHWPFDPVAPAPRLDEIKPGKPGMLEAELAACPEANASLQTLPTKAGRPHELAVWDSVADGIAACGCKADVRYLQALLYMCWRPEPNKPS